MNYKKAGSILLLISGILAILGGAGLLIAGVVFFTMKDNPEIRNALIQGLDNGTITSTLPGTHAQQAEQIQTVMFPSMAISFIIAAILLVVSAVIYFVARKSMARTPVIVALVFSILSGGILPIIGSVLGLIGTDGSKKPAEPVAPNEEPKQEEAKPEQKEEDENDIFGDIDDR